MANQDYAKLPVFIDGTHITQLTSVEYEIDGGQQRVDLLHEGLGGFTPGSGSVTINIGYAVPIGGLEYPYLKRIAAGQYVDMQIGVGSEAYAGRGKIMSSRLSQSVNSSVEGTMTFVGEFGAPE